MPYVVYLLVNPGQTIYYIGMTGSLTDCIFEHKTLSTKRIFCWHGCTRLIYYKRFREFEDAARFLELLESELRVWNLERIGFSNPQGYDLSDTWYDPKSLIPFQALREPIFSSNN